MSPSRDELRRLWSLATKTELKTSAPIPLSGSMSPSPRPLKLATPPNRNSSNVRQPPTPIASTNLKLNTTYNNKRPRKDDKWSHDLYEPSQKRPKSTLGLPRDPHTNKQSLSGPLGRIHDPRTIPHPQGTQKRYQPYQAYVALRKSRAIAQLPSPEPSSSPVKLEGLVSPGPVLLPLPTPTGSTASTKESLTKSQRKRRNSKINKEHRTRLVMELESVSSLASDHPPTLTTTPPKLKVSATSPPLLTRSSAESSQAIFSTLAQQHLPHIPFQPVLSPQPGYIPIVPRHVFHLGNESQSERAGGVAKVRRSPPTAPLAERLLGSGSAAPLRPSIPADNARQVVAGDTNGETDTLISDTKPLSDLGSVAPGDEDLSLDSTLDGEFKSPVQHQTILRDGPNSLPPLTKLLIGTVEIEVNTGTTTVFPSCMAGDGRPTLAKAGRVLRRAPEFAKQHSERCECRVESLGRELSRERERHAISKTTLSDLQQTVRKKQQGWKTQKGQYDKCVQSLKSKNAALHLQLKQQELKMEEHQKAWKEQLELERHKARSRLGQVENELRKVRERESALQLGGQMVVTSPRETQFRQDNARLEGELARKHAELARDKKWRKEMKDTLKHTTDLLRQCRTDKERLEDENASLRRQKQGLKDQRMATRQVGDESKRDPVLEPLTDLTTDGLIITRQDKLIGTAVRKRIAHPEPIIQGHSRIKRERDEETQEWRKQEEEETGPKKRKIELVYKPAELKDLTGGKKMPSSSEADSEATLDGPESEGSPSGSFQIFM